MATTFSVTGVFEALVTGSVDLNGRTFTLRAATGTPGTPGYTTGTLVASSHSLASAHPTLFRQYVATCEQG